MNNNIIERALTGRQDQLNKRGYNAVITSQTADDVQVTIYNNGMPMWKRWSFEDGFFTDLTSRLDSFLKTKQERKVETPKLDSAKIALDNEQYLDNILSVARSIRKPCYAMRLIQYIDNSFPANIHTMYRLQFSLLKTYCDLNRSIICTEDGIQPAIAVVNMITVESIDHETVAHLNCMIAAQYDIIQTGAYMDSKCSYEDFCDKYSHILNR